MVQEPRLVLLLLHNQPVWRSKVPFPIFQNKQEENLKCHRGRNVADDSPEPEERQQQHGDRQMDSRVTTDQRLQWLQILLHPLTIHTRSKAVLVQTRPESEPARLKDKEFIQDSQKYDLKKNQGTKHNPDQKVSAVILRMDYYWMFTTLHGVSSLTIPSLGGERPPLDNS